LEGDLLAGAKNTYIATLVERHSRLKGGTEVDFAGGPISQVGLFNRDSRGDSPGKVRLVRKANVDVEQAFFEAVLNPVHDLALHTSVTAARDELANFR